MRGFVVQRARIAKLSIFRGNLPSASRWLISVFASMTHLRRTRPRLRIFRCLRIPVSVELCLMNPRLFQTKVGSVQSRSYALHANEEEKRSERWLTSWCWVRTFRCRPPLSDYYPRRGATGGRADAISGLVRSIRRGSCRTCSRCGPRPCLPTLLVQDGE